MVIFLLFSQSRSRLECSSRCVTNSGCHGVVFNSTAIPNDENCRFMMQDTSCPLVTCEWQPNSYPWQCATQMEAASVYVLYSRKSYGASKLHHNNLRIHQRLWKRVTLVQIEKCASLLIKKMASVKSILLQTTSGSWIISNNNLYHSVA